MQKSSPEFKTYLLPEHRDSAANFCTIFPYIPLNVASTASQNSLIWEGTLLGIKGAHIDMCSAVINSTESLVKSAIFPYIPLNVASTASQNSLIWEGTLLGIKGAHIDMCSAVINSTESLVKSAILPRQSTSKGDVILRIFTPLNNAQRHFYGLPKIWNPESGIRKNNNKNK